MWSIMRPVFNLVYRENSLAPRCFYICIEYYKYICNPLVISYYNNIKKEFGSDDFLIIRSLFIVCAGNPIDDGNYLVESLDKAMLSRMAIVKVKTTLASWKKNYALLHDKKNNRQRVHPSIISYLEDNRADFLLESAEDDMSDPGMDPRRWDMISRLLYSYEKTEKNANNLVSLLSTLSSKEVTPKLVNYLKSSKVLAFSKIQKQLAEFLDLHKEKDFKAYLLAQKNDTSHYDELIESIQSQLDRAQPVTQSNILSSCFFAIEAESVSDDIFAIMLNLSSGEHIMSIKIGIDAAETFIDKVDEKYSLGINKKVSEGVVKHINKTNPYIAELLRGQ